MAFPVISTEKASETEITLLEDAPVISMEKASETEITLLEDAPVISTEKASETEITLLDDTIVGAADYKGRPVKHSNSGGWKSAYFIIGVEVAERFAYIGISSYLIRYLTGPLGQSVAMAAENVNAWSGAAALLPLIGAFVADSFLGRYRTIFFASLIYILGLGLLTLSAILPFRDPSQLHVILFFFALYLVAVGQGGFKPCIQAFGADQFDGYDPEECKAKSSFFNWWYFGLCSGPLAALLILNYIQDNLGWGLGFGIPCIVMVFSLAVFLLGTKTYRVSVQKNEKNPFARIARVFLAAAKNWKTTSARAMEEDARGDLSHQFRFLNKALLVPVDFKEDGKVCSISDVEEAKVVLRLVPIWTTCLVYAIVLAQPMTFFIKLAVTMDRSVGSGFNLPAASLLSFISITSIIFIPIYDRIFVPLTRVVTGKPSGITMLQRIGTGMFLSTISMVIGALVERKRLETAVEYKLVDIPNATIPMSFWWVVPQYVVFGVSNVFTNVGLQEFFYDQMPNELRSLGVALYLSIFGVGSFLSSFLISTIEKATSSDGHDSWFADNLNRAHVDHFYWLLAGLSAVAFAAYLCYTRSYIYNKVLERTTM